MIIIRPISKKDRDIFVEFSFNSTLGIRNIPKDREKLETKIKISEQSLAKKVAKPGKEEYYFVLEDLSTGHVEGTCGIFASIDPNSTLAFRIQTIRSKSTHPTVHKETKILKLVPSPKPASEVCALYLQPTCRHHGQGRLLSLSRFLFIASHRNRFHNRMEAELRGYIDQHQVSPFWEAIGRHFCDLSFAELMTQIDQGKINLKDILPPYPVYLSLLPKEVQEIVGKTHESTQPALNMLLQEGFKLTNEVDALEGGPSLVVPTSRIRSVKNSRLIQIKISPKSLVDEPEYLVANTRTDFRACYGNIQLESEEQGIINSQVAEALQVKNGEMVRFVSPHA